MTTNPKTLKGLLLTPDKRPTVIADCERLIEEEVAAKKGVSGLAVKTAFKTVKAVKPGIIRESVDGLLDEFVAKMEPFYAAYQNQGGAGGIESYVVDHASEMADALLTVTDERAQRAKNRTLKKAYEKLRPMGKKQVEAAMPRVGRMLARHGA